ncbi:MAG: hypothetical protein DMF83_13810 [Acidobacteria bacterium]|nr:MAG: hypothetical protein DMF83_13810 [Acidobacteriota bacterium]
MDRYWNGLLAGAGKAQACGWLIDRFGLRWQIVPAVLNEMMRDKDPARSRRVTDAMLKMVKLDIAALEKAYRPEAKLTAFRDLVHPRLAAANLR